MTFYVPYHLLRGRVIAHLPTGAGKTRIASHAACHLLNGKDNEDSLVIWLAGDRGTL